VGVTPVPAVGPEYSLPKRSGYGAMEKDVLANGEVVGRVFNAGVSVARPWMWAAMAAFAKSWHSVPRLRMLDEHHLHSLGKLVVRNLDRIANVDNIRN
jgi:hypothetical protein